MDITAESKAAIIERCQRERWARQSAENRFAAEQYIVNNRKARNRSIVAAVALCVIGLILGNNFAQRAAAETGARAGQITAKSDLKIEKSRPEKHRR